MDTGGTLPAARYAHTSSVVGNDILIFGGWTAGSTYLNDLWQYFTGNNTWQQLTPSGTLLPTRYGHTANIVGNNILIFGGWSGSYFNDLWKYDTVGNAWKQFFPPARDSHTASVVGTDIFIFGGWDGNSYFNDFWKYMTVGNMWIQLIPTTSLPTVRYGQTASLIGSDLFIFGGCNGNAYLNDLWKYSIGSNIWQQLSPTTPLPAARRYPTATVVGSDLFIFGGYNGSWFNDIWKYGIVSNIWTQLIPNGSAPTVRNMHTGNVVGNDIFIFGGHGTSYLGDLWKYETMGNMWTQLSPVAPFPSSRNGHSASVVGSELFVFGGWDGISHLNDLWKYSTLENLWTQLSFSIPLSAARRCHTASVVGSNLFIFGGYSGSYLSDLWKLSGIITPTPVASPTTIVTSSTNLFPQGNTTLQFAKSFADLFPGKNQSDLTFTATTVDGNPLPGWLRLSNTSLNGNYSILNAGNYYIIVTATDSANRTFAETLPIRVEGPPVINGTIPFQYAKVSRAFNYFLPDNLLYDPNGDKLVVSTLLNGQNTLPRWLTFNPMTLTFAGTPQIQDRGNYNISISVTDGMPGIVKTTFGLRVDNEPKLNSPIPRQFARVGKPYKYLPDPLTFVHPDQADLTYGADNLPTWLSFSSPPPTFSGTPVATATYTVRFKANDAINGTASGDFGLDVLNNTAPEVIGIPNVRPAPIFKFYEAFLDLSKIFKDATDDVLVYQLKQSTGGKLPAWLSFQPTNITSFYLLSGTPGRSDLNFYTDKTLNLEISATDDLGLSAKANFNIMVTGESWGKFLLKIFGPTFSGLGTLYGLYHKRPLILNYLRKKYYQKDEVVLSLDHKMVALETDADKIHSFQVFELMETEGDSRFFSNNLKPFPGGVFPDYMHYNEEDNVLELDEKKMRNKTVMPYLIVQVKNKNKIITEEIPITFQLPSEQEVYTDASQTTEDISVEPQDGYEEAVAQM